MFIDWKHYQLEGLGCMETVSSDRYTLTLVALL